MEGDEKRNAETVVEEGDEKARDNEAPQQPVIVLKRIPRKKKEPESSAADPTDLDPDGRKAPEEAVEQSESGREQFVEHVDTAAGEEESLEPEEDALEDAEMAENIKDGDDQSDSSLEREFLYRPKKVAKKRKYVLTMQKYKGKKRRKPKVEVPEDNKTQSAEVEEAMPRLESRVKMLSEVVSPKLGPKAKRRPELFRKVQFNRVLKQSVLDIPPENERKTTEPEHEEQEEEKEDNGQGQEEVQQEQVQEDQEQQQQDQEQQQQQDQDQDQEEQQQEKQQQEEQQGNAAETPDNQEQSSPPHSMKKSKEMAALMEATPAVKDVASILESKPSPFDRGIKLRGRKLKRKIDGKFYRGEVADYDRRNRKYKIRFDDGAEEIVMWKDLEPMLVTFEEMSRWDNPEPERDDKLDGDGEDKKKRKKKQQLPKLTPQLRKRPRRN